MIKRILFIIMLISVAIVIGGCDSSEKPFIVSNNLSQQVNLQIFDDNPYATTPLGIGRELGDIYEPTLLLAPDEITTIFTAGVVGGRIGYIVVINDENGKELFSQKFPREELVKHKFKLTITEQGIEYSP